MFWIFLLFELSPPIMLLTDLISSANFSPNQFSSSLSQQSQSCLLRSSYSSEQELPIIPAICLSERIHSQVRQAYRSQNFVLTFNYIPNALKSDYSFDMQELNYQQKLPLCQEPCEICCLEINTAKVQIFNPSVICYNCWHQHIKATVTKISYKTGSEILNPFEGGNPIDVCVALNSLNSEHSVELQEWLFKKYSAFTADIQKCPSETCDYVFTMQKCKWRTNQEQKCPKCQATLVPSTTWDIKGLIGFIYFLFLTNKCPRCEIPIEKTTGCPHMTCPCGHQFCWYCLKDYFGTRNNVYSIHEPKECAFIFLSKIIFMSICILGIILTFLGNQIFQAFIGFFFIGLKYLLLTLFIDLILISNFLVIGHIIQKIKNLRIYGYDNGQMGIKFMIAGLVAVDLTLLVSFYIFEMYSIIGWILLVEAGVAAVGAIGVWLIIYSVETWFDYIC